MRGTARGPSVNADQLLGVCRWAGTQNRFTFSHPETVLRLWKEGTAMICERCGGTIVERSLVLASAPVEQKRVSWSHCPACGRDEYGAATETAPPDAAGAPRESRDGAQSCAEGR